jgi:hypothetical protein
MSKTFYKKVRRKISPLSLPWPFLRFVIVFLVVSLHADFKNTIKCF